MEGSSQCFVIDESGTIVKQLPSYDEAAEWACDMVWRHKHHKYQIYELKAHVAYKETK